MIKKPFSKVTALLVVGTIPAVFAGILLGDWFDSLSKSGVTIGWEFIATGLILWFSDSILGIVILLFQFSNKFYT